MRGDTSLILGTYIKRNNSNDNDHHTEVSVGSEGDIAMLLIKTYLVAFICSAFNTLGALEKAILKAGCDN